MINSPQFAWVSLDFITEKSLVLGTLLVTFRVLMNDTEWKANLGFLVQYLPILLNFCVAIN